MTPSSSSINLLEWFTELRNIVYLLDCWLIVKGYNSGTAKWKNAWSKVCGKGLGASIHFLGVPLSQHLHVFTSQEALRTPYFWDFYGGCIT